MGISSSIWEGNESASCAGCDSTSLGIVKSASIAIRVAVSRRSGLPVLPHNAVRETAQPNPHFAPLRKRRSLRRRAQRAILKNQGGAFERGDISGNSGFDQAAGVKAKLRRQGQVPIRSARLLRKGPAAIGL